MPPKAIFSFAMTLACSLTWAHALADDQQRTFDAPKGPGGYVAVSPDGKLLAAGSVDIRVWEIETGKLLWSKKPPGNGIGRVAFSPDGKIVAFGAFGFDKKVLVESSTGKALSELGDSRSASPIVTFFADKERLATGTAYGIVIWNRETGKEQIRLKSKGPIDSIDVSPDGKLLATAEGPDTVTLWDCTTGKEIRTLPAKQTTHTGTQAVRFSPDGKTLATITFDGASIRIWEIESGKMLKEFGRTGGAAQCLAYSPDGKTIASSDGSVVRLWDVSNGEKLRSWTARGVVNELAFTPDGKALVWYAWDKVVLQPVEGVRTRVETWEGIECIVSRDTAQPGRPIVELDFIGSKLKDADLKKLTTVRKTLKSLNLRYNDELTDAGFKELPCLENLEILFLPGTNIGDEALKQLAALKKLQHLSLAGTRATDDAVDDIASFKELRYLELTGTKISDVAVEKLKKALPRCKIERVKQ